MHLDDICKDSKWPDALFTMESLDLLGSHIPTAELKSKDDLDGIFCLSHIGDIGFLNLG